jgi:hypothetical protein
MYEHNLIFECQACKQKLALSVIRHEANFGVRRLDNFRSKLSVRLEKQNDWISCTKALDKAAADRSTHC